MTTDDSSLPPLKQDLKFQHVLGTIHRHAKDEAARLAGATVEEGEPTKEEFSAHFINELISVYLFTLRRLSAAGKLTAHEILDFLCPYVRANCEALYEEAVPTFLMILQETVAVACCYLSSLPKLPAILDKSAAKKQHFDLFMAEFPAYIGRVKRNSTFAAHLKDLFNLISKVQANAELLVAKPMSASKLLEFELS
jgi:hypothetical protein